MAAYGVKYLGTDEKNEWLPGVPASDHDVETKAEQRALVKSGLYEAVGDDPGETPGNEGD